MATPNANQEIFSSLRPKFETRIKEIGGVQLPNDLDEHLIDLLAETGVWIPRLTFKNSSMEKLADIVFSYTERPVVNFNPAWKLSAKIWGEHDVEAARTCALIHEIMHAVCDAAYEKPPKEISGVRGCNYHISRTLDGQPDKVGDRMRGERKTIEANYANVMLILKQDTSTAIDPMRSYLTNKATLGADDPDLHYDPILFEMLLYMSLKGAAKTPTFKYVKALSIKAAERRIAPPVQSVEVGPDPKGYLNDEDPTNCVVT
jgi:hypothetical protein